MENDTPLFGEVKKVLIVDGRNVVFQYRRLSVIEYVRHVKAYRIIYDDGVNYIKQAQLLDFHPVGIHRGFGCYAAQKYVVLRYAVDND